MKTKNISVGIAGIFLFVAAGLPQTALADKMVKVDMRFAGAFANGISHIHPMTNAPVTSALIHAQAMGRPGKAEIRGFGGRESVVGEPEDCLGIPFGLHIVITENPLVFSFKNLSLLFAKGGGGDICIDTATGETKFVIDIEFMGGRGKFEGATGHAVITGEAEPLSIDGSFLGETGTIVGWIFLPDDD